MHLSRQCHTMNNHLILTTNTLSIALVVVVILNVITATVASNDVLQIIHPYHPLYVHVGSPLKLVCISSRRTTLHWLRRTTETQWLDGEIDFGNRTWMIRSISEEPSGHTESQLITNATRLQDHGAYICHDDNRDFRIYVTIVQILPEPIILTASHVGPAVISCTLTGFDTNPPYVEYVWLRNGLIIATIEQAYASVGGDDGLNVELNKYQVTSPELGKSSLTIDPVYQEDVGTYTCLFAMQTNRGVVNFTQNVYLYGTELPKDLENSSTSRFHIGISALITMLLVFVL